MWSAVASFVFAGLAVTAQSYRSRAFSNAFGTLTLLALLTTMGWIGFAPGAQRCSGSFSIFGFGRSGPASCWPFAAVAVLFSAIVLVSGIVWLRRRLKRQR